MTSQKENMIPSKKPKQLGQVNYTDNGNDSAVVKVYCQQNIPINVERLIIHDFLPGTNIFFWHWVVSKLLCTSNKDAYIVNFLL